MRVLAPAGAAELTFAHNPTYMYPTGYLEDADRFHFLSGDDPAYVVPATPAADDWSAVVGIGPFELAIGDTVTVAVALVAGASLSDLLANSDAAAAKCLDVECGPTAVHDEAIVVGPLALAIAGANPCREAADLEFVLPAAGSTRLAVYDVTGRLVRRLADGAFDGGRHRTRWDGRDRDGRRVPNGVYFVDLRASGGAVTRKLVVLR
jgi:hypothetical protein